MWRKIVDLTSFSLLGIGKGTKIEEEKIRLLPLRGAGVSFAIKYFVDQKTSVLNPF